MNTVVIGAGAFGAWAAHHLQAAGAAVVLVDAYGPANARASSGDESRIIRCGYGPDAIYSRWARRSLGMWQALFEEGVVADAPLFHRCGVLWLAAGQDAYTSATRDTLQREGHPVVVLDVVSLQRRFPHIAVDEVALGLYEPDCGVLMARRAVQVLVSHLVGRGMRLLRGRVAEPRRGSRLTSVMTADGTPLEGDAFVFACGPWLPKVFPELLAKRIRPTRQVVVYFGVPAGEDQFGPERTPAWVDFASGIYGVPDLESRGLKVGIDTHGPPFDPDTGERVADEESIAAARAWLRRRMPAMADAPVVETRVCQYENTATGDFLIDRHPELENVWIAGGGSGHGFKHAPAVGEHVASLVTGQDVESDPRFTIAGQGTEPQRSVF